MKSPAKNETRRKSPPKRKTIDPNPKNEVKEMFFKWFKKNNHAGQIMSKQDIVTNILTKLDAKQDDALEEAMNDLKSYGFVETKEDGLTLVLTQKGAEYIAQR
ncbi:hypothetical protein KJ877_03135 [bacterium]|nr:hypothetical protein [bacterium]MBU1989322.1 hypothetical protein [bacterium]